MRWTLCVMCLSVACGPDAELVADKERLELRVADLEKANARLEAEADGLHAKSRKLSEQVGALQKRESLFVIGIKPGDDLGVRFVTSKGTIDCELWPEAAPLTVANFVQLAEGTKSWTDPKTNVKVTRPLYEGTLFHRVIPNFMIQGGDPLGTGAGGPGFVFEDETDNGKTFDRSGLLAMANRGPDTNGSQFFITDRNQPNHLDGKHTIFGACDDLDVVEAIATAPATRDRPNVDVVLERVDIERP